jgi:hypothetical protein
MTWPNPHAMAFYESVGFTHDGVTQTQFGPAPRMRLDVVRVARGRAGADGSVGRGGLPDQAERVAGRVGEDPEALAGGVQA